MPSLWLVLPHIWAGVAAVAVAVAVAVVVLSGRLVAQGDKYSDTVPKTIIHKQQ